VPDIDLTTVTLQQLIGLTVLVTALDVLGGIALAVIHGTFSLSYVAIWLQSHVLPRVFPIVALGLLGHGFPADGSIVPAIPFAFGLAIAGLTAYVLETIASLRDSFTAKAAPPTDVTPVP
jgi:hypothetical protein